MKKMKTDEIMEPAILQEILAGNFNMKEIANNTKASIGCVMRIMKRNKEMIELQKKKIQLLSPIQEAFIDNMQKENDMKELVVMEKEIAQEDKITIAKHLILDNMSSDHTARRMGYPLDIVLKLIKEEFAPINLGAYRDANFRQQPTKIKAKTERG